MRTVQTEAHELAREVRQAENIFVRRNGEPLQPHARASSGVRLGRVRTISTRGGRTGSPVVGSDSLAWTSDSEMSAALCPAVGVGGWSR